MEEIYQYLKEEDLPIDLRYFYTQFGKEVAIKILETFGGETVYIPRLGGSHIRMPFIRYLARNIERYKTKEQKKKFCSKYNINQRTMSTWLKEARLIRNYELNNKF